jgi:phage gp29-like protein
VKLNFGELAAYPKIKTKIVESKNVQLVVDSVVKLVPLGLEVPKADMRELLGLSVPAEGDEILTAPSYGGGMLGLEEMNAAKKQAVSLNAEQVPETLPDVEPPEAQESDYVQITDEIAEVLEKAADSSTDFVSFQKELEKLIVDWSPGKIAELLAVATFKARVKGNEDYDA